MNQIEDLTPNQQRFAEEYCIDFNATRAYKVAYPDVTDDNTAAASGSRLLRNDKVQAYIDEIRNNLAEAAGISALRIALELKKLIFTNLPDLYEDGKLKDFDELTESERAAIMEFNIKQNHIGGSEDDPVLSVEKKIKMYNKLQAMQELNKMLGYTSNQKIELSGSNGGPLKIEQITGMIVK